MIKISDMEQQTSVTTTTSGVGNQNIKETVESTAQLALSNQTNNLPTNVAQSVLVTGGVGTSSDNIKTKKQISAPSSPTVLNSPGKIIGRNINGTSK